MHISEYDPADFEMPEAQREEDDLTGQRIGKYYVRECVGVKQSRKSRHTYYRVIDTKTRQEKVLSRTVILNQDRRTTTPAGRIKQYTQPSEDASSLIENAALELAISVARAIGKAEFTRLAFGDD